MSTITKERIELFIKNPLENGLTRGEQMELARIALASLEAEPVCVIDQSNLDYLKSGSDADVWPASRAEMGDVLLYRSATPAPVSVPDLKPVGFLFVSDDGAVAYSPAGWPMKGFNLIGPIYGDVNACRAAMLQSDGTLTNEGTMQLSGNSEQIEPVSNRDELPLDYLQGHKDGLEWAAQLAEANHPQTGDWLYDDPIDLARAIRKGPDMPTVQAGNHTEQHLDMVDHSGDANKMVAGNSPVIPNGWKLVPIDPTKDMLRAGQSVVGFWLNTVHCYSKMLAAAPAAPQQEAKNV